MTEKFHLRTFLEPTFCLALLTAILYFWGFAYFSAFCEQLGIRFHGIEIPFTTYLVVGWQHIFYLTMALSVVLCCYEKAIWLLKHSAEFILIRLFKRFHSFFEKLFNPRWMQWVDEDEPKSELIRIGVVTFLVIAGALYGSTNLIEKAQTYADKQLETKKAIVIYDTDYKILKGDFIYLMDYGSALIVGELSAKDEVTRIRILKAGSYAAYSFNKGASPTPETP